MSTVEPRHIIAIGASAGGMEEINTFFDHTPLDAVSYVIVQHLSPDFKSRMVEVVSRHSKLTVKEAENGMTVQGNEVYLIPNDKFMTIRGERLYLTDKDKVKTPHLTINTFFNSLAADSGKKAIAVILSGMGADGTEGIKAIKQAGGMVIARNPETSAFSSMPSNAIATGMVDLVLEPALMPDAIEDYVKQEEKILCGVENEEKIAAAVVALIREQLPLDFSDYKQSTILRRIRRRAEYNNFTQLENYFDFLKITPEEVEILSKEFLISVTAFFRDKEAFEFLQTDVLPRILEGLEPNEELKMWVAGCATGEEAYSLAILLCEHLKGNVKDITVKIFATDIDAAALAFAGKGVYSENIAKDMSPERLEKYFIKEGDNYRIQPAIRQMVIFSPHDLVKNPPYCNMQLISCRNVLIYFTPALQKKVFSVLLFGLKMKGYLFLGSSENPTPIFEKLEVINKKWKIYQNIDTKRNVGFDVYSLPELKHKVLPFSHKSAASNYSNALAEAVNTTLVNDLDYLVVCIDENNQVIKSYGNTTRYLHQKNFNTNIAELLPGPLAIAFNTLKISALKTNQKVTATGIKIKYLQSLVRVSLSVSPLPVKNGEIRLLLVTFKEDTSALGLQHDDSTTFDEKLYHDQYTMDLEEELKELKDKLHSTFQLLDASNENMQSFNEELISANEEMQSANEEMQSVNEELHTINADYQLKNKELQEINDDLNNYFRSNTNGQLFVNNDLQLMKFSPGTVKLINLVPGDIGRPLSDISTNIKFETITDDIKKVLAEATIVTKEIETQEGRWYQVMTMPYVQQAENKRTGAILTFNDITELKRTQVELDKKNVSLLRINADLENFVHTASHDLLAPLGNIEVSISVLTELQAADPQLPEYLLLIDSSIKKFRSLINNIASIAKVESYMLSMEMVNIDELLNNVEWSLADKIKDSGAVIIRNVKVKEILFSKKNLRSIVYNLISNAIKFKGPDSPVIRICTTAENGCINLSVQDNGIGIAKGDLKKVFDIYGRLNQQVEGQGIGLYLAKKIVDTANGNILVESEAGKGSKFTICFKSEPAPSAVTAVAAALN